MLNSRQKCFVSREQFWEITLFILVSTTTSVLEAALWIWSAAVIIINIEFESLFCRDLTLLALLLKMRCMTFLQWMLRVSN